MPPLSLLAPPPSPRSTARTERFVSSAARSAAEQPDRPQPTTRTSQVSSQVSASALPTTLAAATWVEVGVSSLNHGMLGRTVIVLSPHWDCHGVPGRPPARRTVFLYRNVYLIRCGAQVCQDAAAPGLLADRSTAPGTSGAGQQFARAVAGRPG